MQDYLLWIFFYFDLMELTHGDPWNSPRRLLYELNIPL